MREDEVATREWSRLWFQGVVSGRKWASVAPPLKLTRGLDLSHHRLTT